MVSLAAMTIDDLIENFEYLDDWEERYRYLIDLGKKLTPLADEHKTAGNKVHGCMSQVWFIHEVDGGAPATITFTADSDAFIVRGLIAVLLTMYSGKTPAEILGADIDAVFAKLGLANHLSINRRNGFFSMVERIQLIAKQHS